MESEKIKPWLSKEDRLEPNTWHTSRREDAADYEQRQTPAKWAAILTAVINYQNKHHGVSPTDQMISKDTGLSPGQVQYHLKEMEKGGLLRDSKGWPRIITVENVAKVQTMTQIETLPKIERVKEAVAMDTSQLETNKPRKRGGARDMSNKKDFMTRAKMAAQAIIDHYDQYGTAPRMQWLRDKVYGPPAPGTVRSGGGISTIIKKMTQLGWVYHQNKHHRDIALTGLGRAALFGEVESQLHTDTRVNPSDVYRPSIPRPAPVAPIAMEVRRAEPAPPPPPPVVIAPQEPSNLSGVETIDLVIELNRRGFKINR